MLLGPYVVIRFGNVAGGVNEKGAAASLLVGAGVIELDNVAVAVAEQREGQVVFIGEPLMRANAVSANTQDNGVVQSSDCFVLVPKSAGFGCTTGRIVFWIKVKYDPMAAIIA